MGYILLRESMLDSVIRARNKWLKADTGCMFPSHATMYFAAISNEEDRHSKVQEYNTSMNEWDKFVVEMKQYYSVDMKVFEQSFDREQADYYIYSALWTELHPGHVIGRPIVIKKLDINTCTLEDAEGVAAMSYDITIPSSVRISGFAGWFTVDFHGSAQNPAPNRVTLSTGPEAGYTHWGQQVN